jgi:hypothetical protein
MVLGMELYKGFVSLDSISSVDRDLAFAIWYVLLRFNLCLRPVLGHWI